MRRGNELIEARSTGSRCFWCASLNLSLKRSLAIYARGVQNGSSSAWMIKISRCHPLSYMSCRVRCFRAMRTARWFFGGNGRGFGSRCRAVYYRKSPAADPARFARADTLEKQLVRLNITTKGWCREARGASVGGNLPPAVLSQTDDRCRRSFRCGKICTRATPVY